MLVSFSIENFLSFNERAILKLEAASIKEHLESTFTPAYFSNEVRFLKSVAIYGGNSSGKSNLMKGFAFMRNFVLNSSKESQSHEIINTEPFRLNEESEDAPTFFEVNIIIEGSKYRYGFLVDKKAIVQEWLFIVKKRSEENIFVRVNQLFEISKPYKTGELKLQMDMLTQFTRPNALFISVLTQFNIDIGRTISNWFSNSMIIYDSTNEEIVNFTARLLEDPDYNKKINTIIDASGLGFSSVSTVIKEKALKTKYSEQFIASLYADDVKTYTVHTKHKKYKGDKLIGSVNFDLLKNESLGSQKYFGLLGPIIHSLKNGGLLFVDEIDSKLHTHLLEKIIKIFNSKSNNFNGAQLIFTLHNTNPLGKLLRRDQMLFVDKDSLGRSSINSLNKKMPSVRNDASFEKDYLAGKFKTGLPKLGGQLNLFGEKDI